ncbi:MAG TPA: glucosaminidase domain-containing protein [Clostridia bacterium]|nr:glucosaminidase domain-containing protein [Clostridia bacterium]
MTRAERLQFIEKLAPYAIKTMRETGIPASVIIAQATIESSDSQGNWGHSPLATEDNNFFGIKARRRNGVPIEPYCEHNTREWNRKLKKYTIEREPFRKFQSIQECFDRHAELLSSEERYQPAMKAVSDPYKFALQLQLCGYATDPNYASMLIGRIKNWDIARFDAAGRSK